jgi:hypothetical protein
MKDFSFHLFRYLKAKHYNPVLFSVCQLHFELIFMKAFLIAILMNFLLNLTFFVTPIEQIFPLEAFPNA